MSSSSSHMKKGCTEDKKGNIIMQRDSTKIMAIL